jgi:hypothetical protein
MSGVTGAIAALALGLGTARQAALKKPKANVSWDPLLKKA